MEIQCLTQYTYRMKKFSSLKAMLYLLALIPLAFTWGLVVHNAKEREENAVAEILNNAYRLAKYAALEESEYFCRCVSRFGRFVRFVCNRGGWCGKRQSPCPLPFFGVTRVIWK